MSGINDGGDGIDLNSLINQGNNDESKVLNKRFGGIYSGDYSNGFETVAKYNDGLNNSKKGIDPNSLITQGNNDESQVLNKRGGGVYDGDPFNGFRIVAKQNNESETQTTKIDTNATRETLPNQSKSDLPQKNKPDSSNSSPREDLMNALYHFNKELHSPDHDKNVEEKLKGTSNAFGKLIVKLSSLKEESKLTPKIIEDAKGLMHFMNYINSMEIPSLKVSMMKLAESPISNAVYRIERGEEKITNNRKSRT